MKMKIKTILFFFAAISLSSCATKKNTSEKVFVKDSTTTTIQLKTDNRLIIENLCDSITGKAKEFINVSNNGLNSVKTIVKNNTLIQESKTDSIVYVDRFKDKIVIQESEVVRNVVPFKYWASLIVSIIINIGLGYLLINKKFII